MITIEIAGIPIAIDSRFNIEAQQYNGYLTEKQPLEIVTTSDEEIRLECTVVSAYTEQLCILRKIALLCMDYNAFLLHAAVIDVDGQGIAFAARSGTGKTTRVLLWKKALGDRVKVVNGDKPILRFMEDGLYAFGTPWMGKERLGENTSVQMKAVCFIERGDTVALCRLAPKETVPRLFNQILIPKDAARLKVFLMLMERFAQPIPFYLLTCNKDQEDPQTLWTEILNK